MEVDTTSDPAARERELNSVSALTVIVLLGAMTMTFGAMIVVFFYRSQVGKNWGHLTVPPTLWLTTVLLVASSWTFERARATLAHNDQSAFHWLMQWTAGLASAFLLGQIVAWWQVLHSGVVLANNSHSWFIFLFSGLHGLHIAAGLTGIGYLLYRTREPATGPKYQMHTRVAARGVSLCWHYLDFLWIVMFLLLLTWKR